MKKKILSLVLTLSMVMSLMIPAAFANYGAIMVSVDNDEISVGETTTAYVEVDPDLDPVSYSWTCQGVGDVVIYRSSSSSTKVEGRTGGTAVLYCEVECSDGETYSDSVEITVEKKESGSIESVSIDPDDVTLYTSGSDRTCDVEASCDTTGGISRRDIEFKWSSTNSSIARVSGSGYSATITAVDNGSCYVYCQAYYGNQVVKSDYCSVNVIGSSGGISSVTIDPDATVYLSGGSSSYRIAADVSTYGDVDYSDIDYTWTSSNYSIADVSGSGKSATITAEGRGTCYVTCTASYNGQSVKSNSCLVTVVGIKPEIPPAPSIVDNLPSSYSATYGVSDYVSIEAYSSTNSLHYEWYVDGYYVDSTSGKNNQAVSFNTRNLSIGSHSIYCNVSAYYNGYYSDATRSRTCTVKVTDSGSFYITKDLNSQCTTTYGDSNTISFSMKNTTSYSEKYQWYVDGKKDTSSSTSSFNTRYLNTGTHKVYCNVYTSKGGYDVTTRTCTVNVTNSGSLSIANNLNTQYTVTYGNSNTISFSIKNTTSYSEKYQWYVDGKKDTSSSTSSFNTRYLSVGTHSVYCHVYTSTGNYTADTRACTVTVKENTIPTSTGSMNNFYSRNPYNNRFADVYTTNWFYSYVKTAYEYGLVNGKNSANTYCPFDNFTVAEALKIAACINSIYYTGSESALTNGSSTPYWYSIYVNYCVSKGIINQGDFSDYNANCTRAQMAYIFSRCLPSSELSALRDADIPDCNNGQTPYYSNIQTLYNAGIISGDATHCYYPNNLIKRSEVAKIVCTLTAPSTRDRTVF